jgi:hypothetical protein
MTMVTICDYMVTICDCMVTICDCMVTICDCIVKICDYMVTICDYMVTICDYTNLMKMAVHIRPLPSIVSSENRLFNAFDVGILSPVATQK